VYLRASASLLSGWSDPYLLMSQQTEAYRYPSVLKEPVPVKGSADWLYFTEQPAGTPITGWTSTMARRTVQVDWLIPPTK